MQHLFATLRNIRLALTDEQPPQLVPEMELILCVHERNYAVSDGAVVSEEKFSTVRVAMMIRQAEALRDELTRSIEEMKSFRCEISTVSQDDSSNDQ